MKNGGATTSCLCPFFIFFSWLLSVLLLCVSVSLWFKSFSSRSGNRYTRIASDTTVPTPRHAPQRRCRPRPETPAPTLVRAPSAPFREPRDMLGRGELRHPVP